MPTAKFRRYEYRRPSASLSERQPTPVCDVPHTDWIPTLMRCSGRGPSTLSPRQRQNNSSARGCGHARSRASAVHIVARRRSLDLRAPRNSASHQRIFRARSINKLTGRTGPVWQDESFDHVLRGDESLRETMDYVCQNPVRKGLVDKPEDYKWLWVECEMA
jgi:hypothetical protein